MKRIDISPLELVQIRNRNNSRGLQQRKRTRDGLHRETEVIGNNLPVHRHVHARSIGAQTFGKKQEERSDAFLGCLAANDGQVILNVADPLRKHLEQKSAHLRALLAQPFDLLLGKHEEADVHDHFRGETVIAYGDEAEIIARKKELGYLPASIGQMLAKPNHAADDLIGMIYRLTFAEDRLVLRHMDGSPHPIQCLQLVLTL